MPLVNGRIQVAPPGHHLLVMDRHMVLSHGPTENGHRPSINALFRSAAVAAGPAVTGVQLSGALDDGVAGLASIAARGGVVMVQDPAEALYPSMPEQAIRRIDADYVLAAADMGETLAKIVQVAVDLTGVPAPSRLLALENKIAMNPQSARPVEHEPSMLGAQAGYNCPDCQGTLVEVEHTRYRCRIGHAWTADALLEAQSSDWERALGAALRTLDEKTTLGRRMADHARQGGNDRLVTRYERIAEEASAAAAVLRDHLSTGLPTRSEKGVGDVRADST
jgi:two-component system chemotaxis response regulator CheB